MMVNFSNQATECWNSAKQHFHKRPLQHDNQPQDDFHPRQILFCIFCRVLSTAIDSFLRPFDPPVIG
jgi:hypothetical protein